MGREWVWRGLLPALTLALPARAAADATDAPKSITAVRVSVPPRIDGQLDDDAWRLAPPDDRFVQRQPIERAVPSERTEMRVVYDDSALYVAFDCRDRSPSGIVARLTRRDRDVESDWVGFLVDSSDDRATGYAFRVNAAGVQLDAIYFNDIQQSGDWDAVWESATRRNGDGWTAEFRVPLSVLRFSGKEQQEWGFQAIRYISRNKEELYWSYVPRDAQGFVSRAGRLTGLAKLSPRRTFELRPYVSARVSTRTEHGSAFLANASGLSPRTDDSVDVGVDAKLGLTSDLTLDASINPDFGQVEADQVVLNLTRFETFFPEKRPFFLESLDLFQMPAQLFYTRRIGAPTSALRIGDELALDDGSAVSVVSVPHALRILGATKLTGKIAPPLQVGLVGAVTGAETLGVEERTGVASDVEVTAARAYGVGRLRYDFGDASYLGVLGTVVKRLSGTIRRAEADHDAVTEGLDGQWLFAPDWRLISQAMLSQRFGGPRLLRGDGTACPDEGGPGCHPITRTDGTRLEPGDLGWGVNNLVQGSGRHWFFRGVHHSYSAKLDVNDLGFLPQFNEHALRFLTGYTNYDPHGIFRSLEILPGTAGTVTFDGVPREALVFLYTEALFENYIYADFEWDTLPGGTFDTHETFDGARYQKPMSNGFTFDVETDSRARVLLKTHGEAYLRSDSTYKTLFNSEIALQLLPQLEISLTPEVGLERGVRFYSCTAQTGDPCSIDDDRREYAFARLDTGYLSATLRGSWTFSPTLSFTTYAQLFLDRGEWSHYRRVATTGLKPKIYRDDLQPSDFMGDLNGDGIKDDDFEDASLNVNMVLRWEFMPGSTVIGVYTRSESSRLVPRGGNPGFRLRGLGTGPTEDALLLKLVLFVGG